MEEEKLLKRKKRAIIEHNLEQLATVYRKLGELYNSEMRYEDALEAYKEEEKTCTQLGSLIQVAVANRMIGEVYSNMGEYEEALKYMKQHLGLARAENDSIEEQRALATIGRTYFCKAESISNTNQEEYEQALRDAKQAYVQSLKVCDRLQGIGRLELMQMRSRLMLNMGLVLECQGDIEKGIEHIEKAITINKKADLYEDTYRCYSSLALLYQRQDQSSMALRYHDLALEVAERLPDKVLLLCDTLLCKAEVYFSQANYQGAKQALMKAYKLHPPHDDDRKSVEKNLKIALAMCETEEKLLKTPDNNFQTLKKLYEKMGDGCCTVKNFSKALTYYHKMLECAEALGEYGPDLVPVYVSLSQTYKDNGQFDKALEFFYKELELWENNPLEACKTTLNIIQVLELQGSTSSKLEDMYNEAYNLAIKAENDKLQVLVLRPWLEMQKSNGQMELAAETEKKLQALGKYVEESSSSGEEETDTQDIGDSICLELFIDEMENEEFDRPHQTRKQQNQGLKIKRNEKGETQLHVACITGNLSRVKKLLEMGHPVNVQDNGGWLPLQEASNHGFHDIVMLLLDHGARINDPGGKGCGGLTALHDAASNGHLNVMELLLDRGAIIDVRTNDNKTPLDFLMEWYEREQNISPEYVSLFLSIKDRLKKALDKAGVHTTVKADLPPSQSRTPSSPVLKTRGRNKSIQKSNNKISSTTSSKKDERNRDAKTNLRRSLEDPEDFGSKRWCVASSGDSSDSDSDDCVLQTEVSTPSDDQLEIRTINKNVSSLEVSANVKDIGGRMSPLISHEVSSDCSGVHAKEEYQRAITGLRNRHGEESLKKDNKIVKAPQGGFLAADDVGDDWLDDDIVDTSRPFKRRKTIVAVEKRSEFIGTTSRRHCSPLESSESLVSSSISYDDDNDDYDINNIITRSPPETSEIRLSYKRLPIISRPALPRVSSDPSLFQVRTSQEPVHSAVVHPRLTSGVRTVKVRVEDKLLVVSLQDSPHLTIGHLAQQAAQRYYKMEGMTPSLSLLTRDGALLAEDDPISLVLDNDEVWTSVTSWDIPSLTQRYTDVCNNMHSVLDSHILGCLRICEASQALCLEDLALQQASLDVVLQSLQHQHDLHQLNLAGNMMTDKGTELLAGCLKKMRSLEVLNLSSNDLTSKGVTHVTELLSQPFPVLQALTVLDLSHNLLGSDCMAQVHILLRMLLSLHTLHLKSCGLVNGNNTDPAVFYVSSVTELDISYNLLEPDGISAFLSHLNPGRVTSLNLAGTVEQGSIATQISKFLEKDTPNLALLDISNCNVRDPDVFQILRSLTKATKLDSLYLRNNIHLSSMSLLRLVQHQPSPSKVDLSGCYNIVRYLDEASPWLYMKGDGQAAKKKVEVLVSVQQDEPNEMECIENMWRNTWGVQGVVYKGIAGLLRLSTVYNSRTEIQV